MDFFLCPWVFVIVIISMDHGNVLWNLVLWHCQHHHNFQVPDEKDNHQERVEGAPDDLKTLGIRVKKFSEIYLLFVLWNIFAIRSLEYISNLCFCLFCSLESMIVIFLDWCRKVCWWYYISLLQEKVKRRDITFLYWLFLQKEVSNKKLWYNQENTRICLKLYWKSKWWWPIDHHGGWVSQLAA